ncbi:helix-turn-helix domain-containing protein [Salipiger sp. PrR002]|uniref:helix-turn-helix domain-containing protein n=1 Tax=Salipiger sp. PrR002 TaxID=2706489 RepID=UPI0013BDCC5A|nr:helix-turn-helix domain-containing protein [Salipiger sp. PrR002]NDW02491.1 helix-turn-helix domain-containing protein [Salipiger sp. PrR002]NDW59638.1 helix-turn-helix domain-containing protein [Salipiger sp. PrR004]
MPAIDDRLQRDYESQLHANKFAGRCLSLNDEPVEGHLTIRRFGEVLVSEVRASAHVLEVQETRKETAETVFATVMVEGETLLGQAGKWLRLKGGDAAFSLPSLPFTIICPEPIHLLTLQLPRDSFIGDLLTAVTDPLLIPRRAGAARFDQQGLTRNLRRWLSEAHASDEHGLRILSMLEGLLRTEARPGGGRSQFLAALSHIASEIRDPALSPGSVASAIGVSPRQVARIFASHGTTVSQEIAERRLQRAYAVLRDPTQDHLGISEIGRRFGFSGPEVFSRSFRRRFGMTPTQARR